MDYFFPSRGLQQVMTVMIDTNIIISAVLFPHGRAAQAFFKALMPPYEPLICDYVVEELRRKFQEKFPQHMSDLEEYLSCTFKYIRLVSVSTEENDKERLIRDLKDRPILRAALYAHADMILTGDKDFLESLVTEPRIVGVAEFLEE